MNHNQVLFVFSWGIFMTVKILALLLCLNLSGAFAQSIFDTNVLPPFPAPGSVEEQQDIDQLMYFQKTRTPEQCAEAQSEANASLEVFFGGKKGPLTADEAAKAQKKLRMLTLKAGIKILAAKTEFNRPRPYLAHPEIKPCIELENSKSYPSGHATIARVYARVLAVMYPERAALILKRADEVALNRVIGGVHHPSDIVAGKAFGDAIADDYLNEDFRFYEGESFAR
jgi:acid phosphatase (class A)